MPSPSSSHSASATPAGAGPPGGLTVALASLVPPAKPTPAAAPTTTTSTSPAATSGTDAPASPTDTRATATTTPGPAATTPVATTAPTTTPTTVPVPPAVPAPSPLPAPGAPDPSGYVPAGGAWAELRQCESGGNYSTDTGNGYYGAYQFAEATWLGLGYTGFPNQASPEVQDQAAARLQARSGWGQWPACSRKLGL